MSIVDFISSDSFDSVSICAESSISNIMYELQKCFTSLAPQISHHHDQNIKRTNLDGININKLMIENLDLTMRLSQAQEKIQNLEERLTTYELQRISLNDEGTKLRKENRVLKDKSKMLDDLIHAVRNDLEAGNKSLTDAWVAKLIDFRLDIPIESSSEQFPFNKESVVNIDLADLRLFEPISYSFEDSIFDIFKESPRDFNNMYMCSRSYNFENPYQRNVLQNNYYYYDLINM